MEQTVFGELIPTKIDENSELNANNFRDSATMVTADPIVGESPEQPMLMEEITPIAVDNLPGEPLIEEMTELVIKNAAETEISEQVTETVEADQDLQTEVVNLNYDWTRSPHALSSATREYEPTEECENFTKGCLWSPDGTCLLVASEDFRLRVYELPRDLYSGKLPEQPLPPLTPVFSIKDGGMIYDYSWYPLMTSWDPDTCCFVSTSKETPVHLWDAFTGQLRATYRAYNRVDEVEAAISVQFADQGQTVWAGFKGALRSFDTNRPGRQTRDIYFKQDFPNVYGLVSCIRENPVMPGLLAFGTYSKCIGLYNNGPLCSFKASSGVTQIEFSPCGTKLYAAVRRNTEFVCWDLRNPGIILYSLEGRRSDTNQKIQFSLSHDGQEIISGGTDGFATVWRTQEDSSEIEPFHRHQLSKDCVNGVNMHKCLPILATSSGQRLCEGDEEFRDNSVRLWYCGNNKS